MKQKRIQKQSHTSILYLVYEKGVMLEKERTNTSTNGYVKVLLKKQCTIWPHDFMALISISVLFS
jgi:hypothetical protein